VRNGVSRLSNLASRVIGVVSSEVFSGVCSAFCRQRFLRLLCIVAVLAKEEELAIGIVVLQGLQLYAMLVDP